jgi:hypothetical protein
LDAEPGIRPVRSRPKIPSQYLVDQHRATPLPLKDAEPRRQRLEQQHRACRRAEIAVRKTAFVRAIRFFIRRGLSRAYRPSMGSISRQQAELKSPSRSRWNGGFGPSFGGSRRNFVRSESRPTATSRPAIHNVRFTSGPASSRVPSGRQESARGGRRPTFGPNPPAFAPRTDS